jgi:hypothetical protein
VAASWRRPVLRRLEQLAAGLLSSLQKIVLARWGFLDCAESWLAVSPIHGRCILTCRFVVLPRIRVLSSKAASSQPSSSPSVQSRKQVATSGQGPSLASNCCFMAHPLFSTWSTDCRVGFSTGMHANAAGACANIPTGISPSIPCIKRTIAP